jgi:hypothetical protein
MIEAMMATDAVLAAIIAPEGDATERLIERARRAEIVILIPQMVLYWAFHSVAEGDQIFIRRVAELLQYAQIVPDTPEYLGPRSRESWVPSSDEVDNWHRCALGEQ